MKPRANAVVCIRKCRKLRGIVLGRDPIGNVVVTFKVIALGTRAKNVLKGYPCLTPHNKPYQHYLVPEGDLLLWRHNGRQK